MSPSLWQRLAALGEGPHGSPVALVTVVATSGSTPRKAGAKMLVFGDGRIEGTIGGGSLEQRVIQAALAVLADGEPRLATLALTRDLAMCCGGQMTFFVEAIMGAPHLILFGLGHVGRAIAHAAAPLEFSLTLVDDLPANLEPFAATSRTVASYEPADVRALPFHADTYVIIATRDHAVDQRLLELCVTRPHRYLGVIGSTRKARMQRERLLAKGLDPEVVGRVRCPMGLDVGAETPAEIAVAVVAELVAVRRNRPVR